MKREEEDAAGAKALRSEGSTGTKAAKGQWVKVTVGQRGQAGPRRPW